VQTPCRLKDLGSRVVGQGIVDQDDSYPLLPVLGPLEGPYRVFGKQLPANPKISPERALQLPLDPSQLTRIRVDRQQQRPVTPLSDGHDTRLGIQMLAVMPPL
jgi:hypothetical protein